MTICAFMNSWVVSEFDIASQCIVMNVASRASATLLFQSAMRVFFEFLRVPVAKKHQEEEEEEVITLRTSRIYGYHEPLFALPL